jgi:hypothetical protein
LFYGLLSSRPGENAGVRQGRTFGIAPNPRGQATLPLVSGGSSRCVEYQLRLSLDKM